MIDTQRIQSAPRCISGIAEVAATLARGHEDRCTHAIEVTTCFPLDVETIGRVLEGLKERAGIESVVSDEIAYLYIARPDDYNLRLLDLDHGEHLRSNVSFMKHLSALRGDSDWVRKVHEQHQLLRVVASLKGGATNRLQVEDFTSQCDLPASRVQSTLNDLSASCHIMLDIDAVSGQTHYLFPSFDYPRVRYQQNMNLLDELQPMQERRHNVTLLVALLLTLALAAIALATLLYGVA